MRLKIIIVLILAGVLSAATKNIVPRATGEGSIGTAAKHWSAGYLNYLYGTAGNSDSLNHYIASYYLDYTNLSNKPSIPSAYDSASAAANSWKLAAYTPDFRVDLMAESLAVKLPIAGKAASATIADSTNGGAARLNGLAAAAYQDTSKIARTARIIRIMVDSSRVLSAKRTAIFLTGILATDRAWVVLADSTSVATRKRGVAGVCKANSLVVHYDTTAGTVNYMIFR